MTLGFLAGVTERIELGPLVTPVTFRSAPLLAKMLASLDAMAPGRVFCGLGAGWFAREHAAYGLPGHRAGGGRVPTRPTRDSTHWPRPSGCSARSGAPAPSRTAGSRRPPATRGRGPDPDPGRRGRRAADPADRRDPGRRLQPAVDRRSGPQARRCSGPTPPRRGRDPDELRITVLDVPIVGADPDEVARLVERHRGRTKATAYAAPTMPAPRTRTSPGTGSWRTRAWTRCSSACPTCPGRPRSNSSPAFSPPSAEPGARINYTRADQLAPNVAGVNRVNDFIRAGSAQRPARINLHEM